MTLKGLMCRCWWCLLFAATMILSGCGPAHYLRKAKRAIDKAEELGAVWESDTTWQDINVIRPALRNEFEFSFPKQDSAAYFITKDSIRLKLVRVPIDSAAIADKFRAEIECPPVDTTARVPVVVERKIEVKSGIKWWWLVVALAVGALIGILKR